jgi:hypothetical protein
MLITGTEYSRLEGLVCKLIIKLTNCLDINIHFSIFPKLTELPCGQQMQFLKHEYSHDLTYWTDQL